jgi:hypothetical protein
VRSASRVSSGGAACRVVLASRRRPELCASAASSMLLSLPLPAGRTALGPLRPAVVGAVGGSGRRGGRRLQWVVAAISVVMGRCDGLCSWAARRVRVRGECVAMPGAAVRPQ